MHISLKSVYSYSLALWSDVAEKQAFFSLPLRIIPPIIKGYKRKSAK
jgi:hypothetical protein